MSCGARYRRPPIERKVIHDKAPSAHCHRNSHAGGRQLQFVRRRYVDDNDSYNRDNRSTDDNDSYNRDNRSTDDNDSYTFQFR